jgi:cytochrome c-type biogenesis protein CcmF
VSTSSRIDRETQAVGLEAFRDGKRVGIISSEKRRYLDSQGNQLFQPITEVGIHYTAQQDTYVVLAGLRDRDTAELRVTFNPLVGWVWMGGFLMLIGGLIVMWPQAERRRPAGGYAAVMSPKAKSGELAGAV